MNNLVRLSKADNDPRIPVRKSTLYKWKHLKKFPRLFVKISGACFIDLNELANIAEAGRQH